MIQKVLMRKNSGRGLIGPIVSITIVFVIFFGVIKSLQDVIFARKKATQAELSHDVATRKFEDLMNLAFTHPDLDPALNPHVDGNTQWQINLLDTRLKKITITAELVHKVTKEAGPDKQAVGFVGYRYDDF